MTILEDCSLNYLTVVFVHLYITQIVTVCKLSKMFTIYRNWVPCITLLSFGKNDERWFLRDEPIFQYGLFLDMSIFCLLILQVGILMPLTQKSLLQFCFSSTNLEDYLLCAKFCASCSNCLFVLIHHFYSAYNGPGAMSVLSLY